MKTITINAKMSNTGTIHDLASDKADRVIQFRGQTRYAVVLAAYYGGRGYTAHATEAAAAAESHRRSDYSHRVIDCEGNQYVTDRGGLLADGLLEERGMLD